MNLKHESPSAHGEVGGERASDGWVMNNSVGERGMERERERKKGGRERVFFKKTSQQKTVMASSAQCPPHCATQGQNVLVLISGGDVQIFITLKVSEIDVSHIRLKWGLGGLY